MSAARIPDTAEEAARAAGEVLLGFVGRALEVRHKGAVDLVTEADRASEDRIVSIVRERFPEHAILAEEGGGGEAASGAEFLWVVDPLDGTTNFAHGLPIWSVSIGVVRRGVIVAGVVFDPTRGECFRAARGEGAWLNGRRIRVSGTSSLEQALLVTGFPYDVRSNVVNNLDHFGDFLIRARAVRRLGSAALDLAYVACGRFDGFWELKLRAWDMAAGALLVEEAGGAVTRFGGEPLDLFGEEIVAASPSLIPAMREVLLRGARPLSRRTVRPNHCTGRG